MRTNLLLGSWLALLPTPSCRRPVPPPPGPQDAGTGTVTCRERIALPEGAALRVLLLDIDAHDVPGWIVARSERPAVGPVPLPFSVSDGPQALQPRVQHGVSAEILVGGETWFETAEPVPVLTKGHPARVDLLLTPRP